MQIDWAWHTECWYLIIFYLFLFYFFLRLTLLFNNFALVYQVLHNSISSNHPDLEGWMLTRFLEEAITLMLQSLSQTGIKRKYDALGKLSHICFIGSFFLLSLSGSINSGHCWRSRCFPLTPQLWQCSRLLTHSPQAWGRLQNQQYITVLSLRHQADDALKFGGSTRNYWQLPLYTLNSWTCMEEKNLKSSPALLTRACVAQEKGMRPPATVDCGVNWPREKFLPDPQSLF